MADALRALGHTVSVVSPFANHPDDIAVPHPVVERLAAGGFQHDAPANRKLSGRIGKSLRDWARLWLLWPDPEIRWARRAAAHIRKLDIRPDWLLTSNPPESLHIVAPGIKRALGCAWIAEFRDTWTVTPHRAVLIRSALRRVIERFMARRALRHVDAATSVSDIVMLEIRSHLPDGVPDLIIGHFSNTPPPPEILPDTDINIVHSGGFELSDRRRCLETALNAIDAVASDCPDRQFHLHISGALSERERAILKHHKDRSTTKITAYGRVPLQRSRALQAGADALLLHTPEDSHALPGKFSEYRQTGLPILYLGGGSWLDLVDAPDAITPLHEGLPKLRKGQKVPDHLPPPLDATEAARQFAAFLQDQAI